MGCGWSVHWERVVREFQSWKVMPSLVLWPLLSSFPIEICALLILCIAVEDNGLESH